MHAGGQPYSIFGILDTIKIIKPDVQTYGLGACYSYASLILVRAACTGHTVEWVGGELLSKFGWHDTLALTMLTLPIGQRSQGQATLDEEYAHHDVATHG